MVSQSINHLSIGIGFSLKGLKDIFPPQKFCITLVYAGFVIY